MLSVIAFAVAAPPAAVLTASSAEAQLFKRRTDEEGRPRRNLFQRLLGIGERDAPPEAAPRTGARRRSADGLPGVSGRASAGAAAREGASSAARQEPAVDKLDNARVVLVVGDFLASGLGEGLEDAFARSPGVRVVTRANGSSGFVRDDHFDWPGEIGAIITETKPAAVVVMIGANDRQQLLVNGVREKALTDPWKEAYRSRARALADAVRQAGVPLLWMGAPSFKVTSMSNDMIALNDIFSDVAGQTGGEFIDIWDGFVDENGAFMPVGPDMNGQRVRLRGSDGINMTAAGKRKLAFYAERPLNRLLGAAVAPSVAPSILDGAPVVQPLNPADIDRTAPIALADPQLDGGTQLLGARAVANPSTAANIPVVKLVRDGIAPPSPAGRADDFMIGGARPAGDAKPAAIVPSAPAPIALPQTTGTIGN